MRPKKVILCVDDNEQELSVLKFMLATNGYRVVSASNGQEAIGLFAEIAVDLVLGFVLVFALMFSPFLHLAAWRLIELFWLAVWLVCIANAAQGKRFKLPVIGNLAEQQANK